MGRLWNKNTSMHNETETPSRNEVSQDEIAQRAYQLWEASNRPAGRDLEFWLQAEGELRTHVPTATPGHKYRERSQIWLTIRWQ